jgi:hypothetical protein
MVRKLRFVAFIIAACSAAALSQSTEAVPATASFSGTWEAKAENGARRTTLLITQTGDAVTITETVFTDRPVTNTRTLYTDKRGERNLLTVPYAEAPVEVESVTTLKDGKLIRKASLQATYYNRSTRHLSTQRETETYRISKDGKKLIISTKGTAQDRPELQPRREPLPPARPDTPQTINSGPQMPRRNPEAQVPLIGSPMTYQRERVFIRVG